MNNEPVAWIIKHENNYGFGNVSCSKQELQDEIDECSKNVPRWNHGTVIPLYTHPVKEQDDYCKAYWGNDNKFVDVFLPNSETEVIRFWNNTHPVKELTDEEILQQAEWIFGTHFFECIDDPYWIEFAKAILRKAQEK